MMTQAIFVLGICVKFDGTSSLTSVISLKSRFSFHTLPTSDNRSRITVWSCREKGFESQEQDEDLRMSENVS